MGVLVDAYPLVALLGDEPGAGEAAQILRRDDVAMTAVNLAEALDVLERRHGVAEPELRALIEPILSGRMQVLAVSEGMAWRAAALRTAHYRRREAALSLADCVLLAAAGPGDELATSDPAVARAARAEGVDVIALPDSGGRRP